MKTTALVGVLLPLVMTLSPARPFGKSYAKDDADQTSRSVVHKDGTYTTVQRDQTTNTLVRETKHRNGTVVMRSEFALDAFGRESKGRVYDGQNNLMFISEFIYDSAGKRLEERVYNSQGRLVRRLIYQPNRFGRSKPFCATYVDGRPIGELVQLDDPGDLSTTSTHAHNTAAAAAAGSIVRSKDGSSVRLSAGAVQYQGTRTSEPAEKPRRKRLLRIFKRRK